LDFLELSQNGRNLLGVGWSMSRRLQSMSVSTCGDLQNLSLGALQKEFGPKTGQSLYKYCRGQDEKHWIIIKNFNIDNNVDMTINLNI
jgi:DNA repair protein REV1